MCEYVCVGGGGGREGLHHLHRAQAQEVIPANQPLTWRSQAGRGGRCGTLPSRPCPPGLAVPFYPLLLVSSPFSPSPPPLMHPGAIIKRQVPRFSLHQLLKREKRRRNKPKVGHHRRQPPPLPVYTLSLGTSRDSYGLGLWDQVIRFQRSVSAPDTSQIKPVAPFTSLTPSTSTPPLPACSPRTPRQ